MFSFTNSVWTERNASRTGGKRRQTSPPRNQDVSWYGDNEETEVLSLSTILVYVAQILTRNHQCS